MADPRMKWDDNVGGESAIGGRRVSFYVDRECICCAMCVDVAPDSFRASDRGDHRICFKQPGDADELARCYEALESCPVEAIGDDGS